MASSMATCAGIIRCSSAALLSCCNNVRCLFGTAVVLLLVIIRFVFDFELSEELLLIAPDKLCVLEENIAN